MSLTLNRVARAHSLDQARHHDLSHTGSDGSEPGQRITRAGFQWSVWAENVAAGYTTAQVPSCAAGWRARGTGRTSSARAVTRIGVGLARSSDGYLYWTMVLARPA